MNVVSIILALLKIANVVFTWAQENKWIDVGRDAEIARASAAILKKTEAAKAVKEKIDAMDEPAIDDLLKSLEPPDDVRGTPGH